MTPDGTTYKARMTSHYRDVRSRLFGKVERPKPITPKAPVPEQMPAPRLTRAERLRAERQEYNRAYYSRKEARRMAALANTPELRMRDVPFRVDSPEWNAVGIILTAFEVSWNELISTARKSQYSLARVAVSILFTDELGYSEEKVGALLRKDPTTVHYWKKNLYWKVRKNPCVYRAIDCVTNKSGLD